MSNNLFMFFTASKQAYRPPSARGKESNFKLHDDDDDDIPTIGDSSGNILNKLCC